jgi:hypothetical protein
MIRIPEMKTLDQLARIHSPNPPCSRYAGEER